MDPLRFHVRPDQLATARGPLFALGRLLITPGALRAFGANDTEPIPNYLVRHAAGDWGALSADDVHANVEGLAHGERLLSAYHLPDGTKIWIITEADRSATTILLPDEY
jgi:hypothetical protein